MKTTPEKTGKRRKSSRLAQMEPVNYDLDLAEKAPQKKAKIIDFLEEPSFESDEEVASLLLAMTNGNEADQGQGNPPRKRRKNQLLSEKTAAKGLVMQAEEAVVDNPIFNLIETLEEPGRKYLLNQIFSKLPASDWSKAPQVSKLWRESRTTIDDYKKDVQAHVELLQADNDNVKHITARDVMAGVSSVDDLKTVLLALERMSAIHILKRIGIITIERMIQKDSAKQSFITRFILAVRIVIKNLSLEAKEKEFRLELLKSLICHVDLEELSTMSCSAIIAKLPPHCRPLRVDFLQAVILARQLPWLVNHLPKPKAGQKNFIRSDHVDALHVANFREARIIQGVKFGDLEIVDMVFDRKPFYPLLVQLSHKGHAQHFKLAFEILDTLALVYKTPVALARLRQWLQHANVAEQKMTCALPNGVVVDLPNLLAASLIPPRIWQDKYYKGRYGKDHTLQLIKVIKQCVYYFSKTPQQELRLSGLDMILQQPKVLKAFNLALKSKKYEAVSWLSLCCVSEYGPTYLGYFKNSKKFRESWVQILMHPLGPHIYEVLNSNQYRRGTEHWASRSILTLARNVPEMFEQFGIRILTLEPATIEKLNVLSRSPFYTGTQAGCAFGHLSVESVEKFNVIGNIITTSDLSILGRYCDPHDIIEYFLTATPPLFIKPGSDDFHWLSFLARAADLISNPLPVSAAISLAIQSTYEQDKNTIKMLATVPTPVSDWLLRQTGFDLTHIARILADNDSLRQYCETVTSTHLQMWPELNPEQMNFNGENPVVQALHNLFRKLPCKPLAGYLAAVCRSAEQLVILDRGLISKLVSPDAAESKATYLYRLQNIASYISIYKLTAEQLISDDVQLVIQALMTKPTPYKYRYDFLPRVFRFRGVPRGIEDVNALLCSEDFHALIAMMDGSEARLHNINLLLENFSLTQLRQLREMNLLRQVVERLDPTVLSTVHACAVNTAGADYSIEVFKATIDQYTEYTALPMRRFSLPASSQVLTAKNISVVARLLNNNTTYMFVQLLEKFAIDSTAANNMRSTIDYLSKRNTLFLNIPNIKMVFDVDGVTWVLYRGNRIVINGKSYKVNNDNQISVNGKVYTAQKDIRYKNTYHSQSTKLQIATMAKIDQDKLYDFLMWLYSRQIDLSDLPMKGILMISNLADGEHLLLETETIFDNSVGRDVCLLDLIQRLQAVRSLDLLYTRLLSRVSLLIENKAELLKLVQQAEASQRQFLVEHNQNPIRPLTSQLARSMDNVQLALSQTQQDDQPQLFDVLDRSVQFMQSVTQTMVQQQSVVQVARGNPPGNWSPTKFAAAPAVPNPHNEEIAKLQQQLDELSELLKSLDNAVQFAPRVT